MCGGLSGRDDHIRGPYNDYPDTYRGAIPARAEEPVPSSV